MKMYMFKSEAKAGLHAFADEANRGKLPAKFAPWTVTGVVAAGRAPPHGLPRGEIEDAIRDHGFQLWRFRQPKQ